MKIAGDDLVTREGASRALDRNVRTIGRALAHVPPDDEGPPPRRRLSTVRDALVARAERVNANGYGNCAAIGGQIFDEIDRLTRECQRGLDRLYGEPDVGKRRAMLHGGCMRCFGDLDNALQRSLDLVPADMRPMTEVFVNSTMRGMLGKIFWLLGITQADVDALGSAT